MWGGLDKYAKTVIRILQGKGYDIVVICNRPRYCNDGTEFWLKKSRLKHIEMIYEGNTVKALSENNIDLYIGDYVEDIIDCLSNTEIPVIMLNRDYNKDLFCITDNNITSKLNRLFTSNNWFDVLRTINYRCIDKK